MIVLKIPSFILLSKFIHFYLRIPFLSLLHNTYLVLKSLMFPNIGNFCRSEERLRNILEEWKRWRERVQKQREYFLVIMVFLIFCFLGPLQTFTMKTFTRTRFALIQHSIPSLGLFITIPFELFVEFDTP